MQSRASGKVERFVARGYRGQPLEKWELEEPPVSVAPGAHDVAPVLGICIPAVERSRGGLSFHGGSLQKLFRLSPRSEQ